MAARAKVLAPIQGGGVSLRLRAAEDHQRTELASAVASAAKCVAEHSQALQAVAGLETERMIFLFSG